MFISPKGIVQILLMLLKLVKIIAVTKQFLSSFYKLVIYVFGNLPNLLNMSNFFPFFPKLLDFFSYICVNWSFNVVAYTLAKKSPQHNRFCPKLSLYSHLVK